MIEQLLNDIYLAEERVEQAEIALINHLTKRYKAKLYRNQKGFYVVMPRGQKPVDEEFCFGYPIDAWLSFAHQMKKREQDNG